MAYEPLLDAWRGSRRERTELHVGNSSWGAPEHGSGLMERHLGLRIHQTQREVGPSDREGAETREAGLFDWLGDMLAGGSSREAEVDGPEVGG